jgi:uncharacterized protein with PQ loop repeat
MMTVRRAVSASWALGLDERGADGDRGSHERLVAQLRLLPADPFVMGPNLVAAVLGLYYILATMPLIPASRASDLQTVQAILILGATEMLAVWTIRVFGKLPHRTMNTVLGAHCAFLTVLRFASPLSTVRTVVTSTSSASIQAPLVAAQFVNCLLWSIYGSMIHDMWVWGANIAGLLLAIVQTSLKLIYRGSSGERLEELEMLETARR